MKNKKKFRSRISILLIVLAIFIPISIPILQKQFHQGFLIFGVIMLFVIFLFTGMRYIIYGSDLIWKIWFIPCGNINIKDIRSVVRSYNPLSSPAASLKRLRISFKKGEKFSFMLISPYKEKEFIKELKAINPDIIVTVPDKKSIWCILDWDI